MTFVKGLHAVAAPEAAECLEALVVADDAAITAKMLLMPRRDHIAHVSNY